MAFLQNGQQLSISKTPEKPTCQERKIFFYPETEKVLSADEMFQSLLIFPVKTGQQTFLAAAVCMGAIASP
jgi:hypothetical protein